MHSVIAHYRHIAHELTAGHSPTDDRLPPGKDHQGARNQTAVSREFQRDSLVPVDGRGGEDSQPLRDIPAYTRLSAAAGARW